MNTRQEYSKQLHYDRILAQLLRTNDMLTPTYVHSVASPCKVFLVRKGETKEEYIDQVVRIDTKQKIVYHLIRDHNGRYIKTFEGNAYEHPSHYVKIRLESVL